LKDPLSKSLKSEIISDSKDRQIQIDQEGREDWKKKMDDEKKNINRIFNSYLLNKL